MLIVTVVAVVATSVSGVFREDTALEVTGPDQLIAQVQAPHVGGYSGTILAQTALGLPKALNTALTSAAPAGQLLRGSHNLRYWYGGTDRQRVAVVSQTSEQDLFRNGADVWQWDTSTRVARRSKVVAADDTPLPLRLASSAALTPPQLAAQILDLVGDSTDTTLRSGDPIADRPTYELVIEPTSTSSRIGAVHIEIDGRQAVPLGVQIYPIDGDKPILDVSFTSITFAQPADQNFTFTPPADADVRSGSSDVSLTALDQASMVGTGWTSAVTYRSGLTSGARLAEVLQSLLGDKARRVKGTWGQGRLLQTPVITVLVTDTGQIVAGAVTPDVLYRAVG